MTSNISFHGISLYTAVFFLHKVFWIDTDAFLVRSMNHFFNTGELSITQKHGVITCIPKGKKGLKLIENWRPMSLLNVSYKIIFASLTIG